MGKLQETKEHLTNEQQMRQYVFSKWGGYSYKPDFKYSFDDVMLDNNGIPWAIVEYKNRKMSFNDIDTTIKYNKLMRLFISTHKINIGRQYATLYTLPFYLVFRLNGEMFYTEVTNSSHELGIDGRTDRGLAADIEPVFYFTKEMLVKF